MVVSGLGREEGDTDGGTEEAGELGAAPPTGAMLTWAQPVPREGQVGVARSY